jgi:hypothetical protein
MRCPQLDRIGVDERDLAPLGNLEQRRVFLVELPQLESDGSGTVTSLGVDLEELRIAALAAVLPQRLHQRPGRLDAAAEGVGNRTRSAWPGAGGDELAFADAVLGHERGGSPAD